MPTIRFDLNEEYKAKLEDAANEMNMKLQDYIRYKLFDLKTIFTVDEAIKRIQNGGFDDTAKYPDGFTLPDVYGTEWTIERGLAGVFGKTFFNYVTRENTHLGIEFKDMGKNGRLAHYTFHRN